MSSVRVEHTERGRWGGRLTQCALPDHDPTIDALTRTERERLAEIWIMRAAIAHRARTTVR